MPTRDPDVDASVSAAHILGLLDSVQEQLAEIRRWADQLISKEAVADDDR